MENSTYCRFHQSKNTIFVDNMDKISHLIGEILPFSKIAILYFPNEFFEFGNQFKQSLLKNNLKIIEIVVDYNFSAEKEKFSDFLSLPEDVRGVIAFNRKLIPLLLSNFLNDKKRFFIERGAGVCGLFQNQYYYRDYKALKQMPKSEQVYIIVNAGETKINNYIKSACLYVNMLIDYILGQKLMEKDIDMLFVNKVKSILIDTLFILKGGKEEIKNNIIENLLCVESLSSAKDCYYSCSAVISSFLACDDFFNIDYSFSASKIIVKKYEMLFNKTIEIKVLDYNQVAKTLAFMSRLNENQVLSELDSKIKKIKTKGLLNIKGEIKKLILLYYDFAKYLIDDLMIENKFHEQTLLLSVDLSGFTPFGINGMTAVAE